MNFEKALSILGLTRSYTEEDIKKAYRILISKYHPDFYEQKSEKEKRMASEKTQELNTAKDYLEKCLKDRQTSGKNTNTGNPNYYNTSSRKNTSTNFGLAIVKKAFNIILSDMIKEIFTLNILTVNYNHLYETATIILKTIDEYVQKNNNASSITAVLSFQKEYYSDVKKC